MFKYFIIAFTVCAFNIQNVCCQTEVQLDSTILVEREVATGIIVPWEMTYGPDDHLWITEKRGRILRIDPENGNMNTILAIETFVESGSEPGLLGMALHPDFENTPLVYIAYTYVVSGNTRQEKLVQYEWDGTTLSGATTLLDGIQARNIHNGSRLLISSDNKILMTTGDVGNGDNSQNLSNLNGKILRINLDGSVPEDNPMTGSYIYSYGHRNPQGLAYGPNGQLYSSEHGAQSSDEFNIIEAGRNYGWPEVEGFCNTTFEMNYCKENNIKEPLDEYTPCVAVNDICYYQNSQIPEWQGKMLMAVLGGFVLDPRLTVISFNDDGTEVVSDAEYFSNYGRLRDVCINTNSGSIYFATNGFSYPSSGPNRIIEYFPKGISSVDNPSSEIQFMELYPNPVALGDELVVEFSQNFIGEKFEVFTYAGERIITGVIEEQTVYVQTQSFERGNYYIVATNKLGTISKQIVIQ